MVEILWEQDSQTLSALTAFTYEEVSTDHKTTGLDMSFRIASMHGVVGFDKSDLNAQSRLAVLLVDGDLTASEIEECMESITQSKSNQTEIDRNRRRVFFLTDAEGVPIVLTVDESSKGFKTKINKTFYEGSGWAIGVYNYGTGTAAAAIAISWLAKYYGVWVD